MTITLIPESSKKHISSKKIILSSREHLLPLKDRYIHTPFIDLLEKYSPSPNETQLKDFLIEKFIQER